MTKKALRRLKDSMALSTSTDLRARPSREHSPARDVKDKEGGRRDNHVREEQGTPYVQAGVFFENHAAISVPPEEASMLKRMAEPRAGRITAKNSSSMSWSVRGRSMGNAHSKS